MLYKFVETQLPSAGAYQYAFYMSKELPLLRRLGAGVPRFQSMSPIQPPQYMQQQRFALAGYGGLTAGGIYGTPLSLNPLGLPSGKDTTLG